MTAHRRTVPYDRARLSVEEMRRRMTDFRDELSLRRSVRHFSPEPVPDGVIEAAIEAAGTAPSGAHKQPWTFVVVRDPEIRRRIRAAAEEEERRNYGGRMSPEWLEALAPLGTDWQKEFLEIAPVLIVVFRQDWGGDGNAKVKHYYVSESVGIATGFLLAALNVAGLATLTHTPSPMGFLSRILGRPPNERPFLLIPAGFPAPDCRVPALRRKSLEEILISM